MVLVISQIIILNTGIGISPEFHNLCIPKQFALWSTSTFPPTVLGLGGMVGFYMFHIHCQTLVFPNTFAHTVQFICLNIHK